MAILTATFWTLTSRCVFSLVENRDDEQFQSCLLRSCVHRVRFLTAMQSNLLTLEKLAVKFLAFSGLFPGLHGLEGIVGTDGAAGVLPGEGIDKMT